MAIQTNPHKHIGISSYKQRTDYWSYKNMYYR